MKGTIEEMQKIAKERGGKCLSEKYIDNKTKLNWQCKRSHQWKAVPGSIKSGTWCPDCAGTKKGTIEEMRKIAIERGGKCLSEEYGGDQIKLLWQCEEGHQWKTAPGNIKQGRWCPVCAGTQKCTIEDMRKIAKERNGECLSKKYINNRSKLKWRCKDGHEWEAVPGNVQQGNWCPVCAGVQKSTIEEMHKIAQGRGGKCLSKIFIHAHSKLVWQCKEGHQWEATPGSIKNQETWCPMCGGTQRGTIEEMQEIAEERGGKCLSKEYINNRSRLKWQCKDYHQWEASPASIKLGNWCPHCHIYYGEEIVRLYFEKIFNRKFPRCWPNFLKENGSLVRELDGYNVELGIAFEHQGRQHYKHVDHFHKDSKSLKAIQEKDKIKEGICRKNGVKLIVIPSVPDMISIAELPNALRVAFSKNGIEQSNIPENLDINVIYKQSIDVIDALRKCAELRQGRLISAHYLGNHIKLTWQCQRGHQWDATPGHIKDGRWCPDCAGKKKATIEQMQKMAEDRGGQCLSKKYINDSTKLEWQCKAGHEWKAVPGSIKQGSWCAICAGVVKGTIENMKRIAIERGGKCLSEEYISAHSPLAWECKNGHQWKADPDHIKNQKTWCPVCARKK